MVAALYRRYRPEAFSEMIGQSQVTDPLMTALRTGRIGHAYLFSGPRGCGKTTSARILARCLNCAEGPTDTPCGVCPSCVELSRDGGGSLDVVEIDAASHGGVDDARDLRERAVFAPARDRFKIFIIDEAHMVTPGGFNALLKIVEEPPPHVKFVFATTEPDKVIGTIRSRTHHYPFRLIAPGTLIDYVQQLCDSEGVQVEPGVLPLVVRSGGGSVRDTLSILDQLIAGSEGSSVSTERAAGLLGFTHTELLDDVVSAFAAKDPGAAFRATDRVVQTGQDPRRFVEDLLERLRDLIVVGATTVDGAAAVFRGVPQDQLDRMFEQSRGFARGELSRLADVVSEGLDSMSGATAPRMQLELMIARALVQAEEAAAAAPVAGAGQNAGGGFAGGGAPQAAGPGRAAAAGSQQAPAPQQPSAPAAAQAAKPVPNAAETAASIREFLRGDSAGAAAQPETPAAGAPAPGAAPAPAQPEQAARPEPAQQQVAPQQPAPQQPAPQHPVPQPAEEAGPPQPSQPRQPQPAAQRTAASGERHPNEGAAGFGRPISDILSAAQIESIGTEQAAAPAAPAPAAPQSPGASAAAPPQPGPGSSGEPQPGPAPVGAESGDGAPGSGEGLESEEAGGFEDLVEVWPDLLEEILEQDREAWNAVKDAVPMSLERDILALGFRSGSDLAAFKAAGAAPLREAIMSAVGISVKYVPKRAPSGAAPAAPGAPRETGRPADAEEPEPGPPSDDPVQRAARRLSALGPALAAPAWADPPAAPPAQSASAAAPVVAQADPDPEPASSGTDETPVDKIPAGENPADETPAYETPAGEPMPAEPAPEPVASSTATDPEPATHPKPRTDPEADAAVPRAEAQVDALTPPAERSGAEPREHAAPVPSAPVDDDPYAGDPYAGEPSEDYEEAYGGDPYGGAPKPVAPGSAGPSAPASAPAPAPAAPAAPLPQQKAEPPAEERPAKSATTAPKFTRYGEAVVREVLGARFVEERPLPGR